MGQVSKTLDSMSFLNLYIGRNHLAADSIGIFHRLQYRMTAPVPLQFDRILTGPIEYVSSNWEDICGFEFLPGASLRLAWGQVVNRLC